MPRKKASVKRAYGEGSVFQRKEDGIWVASFPITNGSGKRVPKRKTAKTEYDANALLAQMQKDAAQGLMMSTKEQTTEQFLAAWLSDSVKPRLAPRTYEDYAETVKRHIEPHIGRVPLARLTPQDVQKMLATVAANVSPPMALRARRILRAALNRAMKWGYVARNAAALTDAPKVTHNETTALTPAEATAFLAAAAGDRLEALYTVALSLGLRQGEALGLCWQDVDLEARTLAVRCQLQRVDGKPALVEPKTPQSRRTLALPALAVDALRRHRIRQLEERLWAGSRWQEQGLVFTSTIGTPIDEHNLRRQFRALLATAKIRHIRFHDLRHSAGSLLAAQGATGREIMDVLGHSQISTTARYTHVYDERRVELAAKMDAALTPRKAVSRNESVQ